MILKHIQQAQKKGQKLLAILLDPEKVDLSKTNELILNIHRTNITHIFVGGSTDRKQQIGHLVNILKAQTELPIILFPGDYRQITSNADAILFLSLLSGRNPEFLIDQHIKSIPLLENSNLEVIPTGYILIDGGIETTVQKVSKTQPISQDDIGLIKSTAMAGYFSGKQLIYLEAGSGALTPVRHEIIKTVRKKLTIPILVGGGIRSKNQLDSAYEAGADLVIIGTAFEENKNFFNEICH